MKAESVKTDCFHYRGHIPCWPNKKYNVTCDSCSHYKSIQTRVLIIKLAAIGDVIRTTPLLKKLRETYQDCHISWVTDSTEMLSPKHVDQIYKFNFKSTFILSNAKFDIAINLDKDLDACTLLDKIQASQKFGFGLKAGAVFPVNPLAEHKYLTGIFDHLSKENKKNYLQEIFELCGFEFNQEPYVLEADPRYKAKWAGLREQAGSKKIIGLNIGCGTRWLTRLWPDDYWFELIRHLQNAQYYPILLGGKDEDEKNKEFSEKTKAFYPGTFSLLEFISLTSHCDLIVSAVTMMMHIAIGLKIPLVLFNNIFNPNEFELYDNGIILQPDTGCDCYYGNTCQRNRHCMYDLPVNSVHNAIDELMDR